MKGKRVLERTAIIGGGLFALLLVVGMIGAAVEGPQRTPPSTRLSGGTAQQSPPRTSSPPQPSPTPSLNAEDAARERVKTAFYATDVGQKYQANIENIQFGDKEMRVVTNLRYQEGSPYSDGSCCMPVAPEAIEIC